MPAGVAPVPVKLPQAPLRYDAVDQNRTRRMLEVLLKQTSSLVTEGSVDLNTNYYTKTEVNTLFDALDFTDIDGQIGNAQVPASAVTQHQAALSIAYTQLTYSGLTAGHALVASSASAASFRALTAADIGAGAFPGAFYSFGSLPASTGRLRFSPNDALRWPNSTLTGDIEGIRVGFTNDLHLGFGSDSISFEVGAITPWTINSSGHLLPSASSYDIGATGGGGIGNLFAEGLVTAASGFLSTAGAMSVLDAFVTGTYYLQGAAGTNRDFHFQTGGADRWIVRVSSSAESGGNAGSGFNIVALDDAGSVIDAPLSIVRAAGGLMSLNRPVSMSSTLNVTGAITGPLAYTNLTYSGLTSGHALVASSATAAAFRALTAADITAGTFPGSSTFAFGTNRLTIGTDPSSGNAVLGIAGSATQRGLWTAPTVSVSGAVAIGWYHAPALTAAANNDVLRAVQLSTVFATGGFTGVEFTSLFVGDVSGGASNFAIKTGLGTVQFGGQLILTAATPALRVNNSQANGSVAVTITSVGPTGAQTTIQGWIPVSINGTTRYIPFW